MLLVWVEYTENEAGRFFNTFVFADHVCMMCMWWPDYKDDDDDPGNEDIKMRNTDFDVMTTTKNALLLPLPFLLLMVVLIMLNDLSHFAVEKSSAYTVA